MALLPPSDVPVTEIRKIKQINGLPKGGITVELAGGKYELTAPVELDSEDSGTDISPVVYRNIPGEKVQISGSRTVTDWKQVTDENVLEKFDPSARGKVFQSDLRDIGIQEFGELGLDPAWELQEYLARIDNQGEDWIGDAMAAKEYSKSGKKIFPRMELFFNDIPMEISHWPNTGFARIKDVLGKTELNVRGVIGCREGIFVYNGNRPDRWTKEKDGFVRGYWFRDWELQCHKIASIDTIQNIISVEPPYHYYGYRKGQWFYGLNMMCELTMPGEFYIDRGSGILYFWPPAPIKQARVEVSVSNGFFILNNSSFIKIQNLDFKTGRGTAVIIKECQNCNVTGCTFLNMGNHAVTVFEGKECSVTGCDISNSGGGGIYLVGGDRKTLTPAGHYADNNHIHHFGRWDRTYRPGIFLSGVGLRASHNLIHNAPHAAILFGGMENTIEYNEIHDVCQESNDAGTIYAGRSWTLRGNIIRYNYLHDISGFEGKGCVGVYLDDAFSGAEVTGNIFKNVTESVKIGGGRDNNVINNIFVDCAPSLEIDARGMGWMIDLPLRWVKEANEKGTVGGIAFDKPPYSTRYPRLMTALTDEPTAPKGNVVARNVCFGGSWDKPAGFWKNSIEKKALPYLKMEDNVIAPNSGVQDSLSKSILITDPMFTDRKNPEKGNFQLDPGSPAFSHGFIQIPFEKIGPYKSNERASWPVKE